MHITSRHILIAILTLAVITRFFRLEIPSDYVFDEVYHAFTAQQMAKGNQAAWEWWNTSPKDFAYEWTHPPLAKEMMVVGIKLFSWLPGTLERIPNYQKLGEAPLGKESAKPGDNPFGWRFPVALFSVGIVLVMYLLGKELFSETVGLIAAFFTTCDGLFLTMGRIGMNDTFFLFFQLLAFLFFIKYLKALRSLKTGKKFLLLTGISLGLALASKWTGLYGIGIMVLVYGISYFVFRRKSTRPHTVSSIRHTIYDCLVYIVRGIVTLICLPVLVYLITYIPFFLTHTWPQFMELQRQMWWYHTHLKATHGYQSTALSWPLMIRPVWYYVKYGTDNTIGNIYALGNPSIWWVGIAAVIAAAVESSKYLVVSIKNKKPLLLATNYLLLLPLVAYFGFFLPWVFSPRIMFLYHYFPSLAFLILILAEGLGRLGESGKQGKIAVMGYLVIVAIFFLYFYPQLTALMIPRNFSDQYYWLPTWK